MFFQFDSGSIAAAATPSRTCAPPPAASIIESMSKTKTHRPSEPLVKPKLGDARPSNRPRWIVAGALLLVALAGAAVWADWYYGLPEGAERQYVGRQTC